LVKKALSTYSSVISQNVLHSVSSSEHVDP